jgi:hypothetical protein
MRSEAISVPDQHGDLQRRRMMLELVFWSFVMALSPGVMAVAFKVACAVGGRSPSHETPGVTIHDRFI